MCLEIAFRAHQNLYDTKSLRSSFFFIDIKLQLATAVQFKNQAIARDINDNMLRLTKDTVDDSATVRVVTLVTLIYLPASFVASILGMNLFTFETSQDSGFRISPQFWIFIALAVPLTLLTVGSWFVIMWRSKKTNLDTYQKLQNYT